MKRLYTTLLLTLALAATAFAADVSFTVTPPRRVYENDKFAITFRLSNAEGSNLHVEQIGGCKLLYGPSESRSQSYQIVNGRASGSSSIEYTYYYRAGAAGAYTIPAATVVADGKRYATRPVKFNVLPGGDRDKPATSRPVAVDDPDTQAAGRQVKSNDVFVRIILSRSSAYEQEAIGCTIKLYTKYSISSFMPTRQPAFDGFLIQELDVQPALNEVETYNGQQYMTAVLKRCIIFPQKSGRLTINSGNYDISVVQYDNVNMGMFQVRQPREAKIKVSSNTGTIDIRPLPHPAPEGFDGAVGQFTANSRLVGNSFRTGDPGTLIFTVRGTGNIKYLKEPDIDFPSEFELYTPKSDIQANVAGNDVTGVMNVEYTFVPQSVGDFRIGGHKFVYFDPKAGQYKTIQTEAYNVKVAKGVATSTSDEQKAIEAKNRDIRHIYLGDKNPVFQHNLVILTPWYWALYIGAIAVLAIIIYAMAHNARRRADVTGLRRSKANKVARQRLRAAQAALKSGNTDKFYEELLRATWGYLSDKLTIPLSELTRQNVAEKMAEKGYSQEVADAFIKVLDDSEMARYTSAGTDPAALYAAATDAINAIEKK